MQSTEANPAMSEFRPDLLNTFTVLPPMPAFAAGVRRAPKREFTLSAAETELALKNALRYLPEAWHEAMAPEFLEELLTRGRIYGYRFRPQGRIYGRPVTEYPGKPLPAGRSR